MPENTLTGGKEYVGGDESPGRGIVVSRLQVVEPGLVVVHVSAVAERLNETQCARKRAGCCHLLSPRIIYIFYDRGSCAVNQFYNIALPVANVIILIVVVLDRYDIACSVVAEQELALPALHADQHRAVVEVVGVGAVNRFLLPQSVLVVFKCDLLRTVHGGHHLLALPREGVAPIRQRVAHAVVADRLPVVACQLILPAGIGVRVINRARGRCGQGSRRICIGLLVQDVAEIVVFVGDGLVRDAVVLTREAVCGVVFVRDRRRSLRDRGDVAVVVVAVDIRIVIAVVVPVQQRRAVVPVQPVFEARFVTAAEPPCALRQPAEAVVRVRQHRAGPRGRRLRPVVTVVGIDGVPRRARDRAGEFREIVAHVVFVSIGRKRRAVVNHAVRDRERALRARHAAPSVVVLEEACSAGAVVADFVQIAFADEDRHRKPI